MRGPGPNVGRTSNGKSGEFKFDLQARTADIRLPRARIDRRSVHIKFLLLLSSLAVVNLLHFLEGQLNIFDLAFERLGYVLGFLLVALPILYVLSQDKLDLAILAIQRKKSGSKIHITDDAFIFNPGGRREIRLSRHDLIAGNPDPRKKKDNSPVTEYFSGLAMKSKGRQIQVLDRCLGKMDYLELTFLLASWGQSFDQMIEAYIQSGMAQSTNWSNFSDITEAVLDNWLTAVENAPSFQRIDSLTKPTAERAIAFEVKKLWDPNFIATIKRLSGYSLYFELRQNTLVKSSAIYAVFRRDEDAPQTLQDIVEMDIIPEDGEPLKRLTNFLYEIETHPEAFEIVTSNNLLPAGDAQMFAKEVLGEQIPKLREETLDHIVEAVEKGPHPEHLMRIFMPLFEKGARQNARA